MCAAAIAPTVRPDFASFQALAHSGFRGSVPLYARLAADQLTPLAVYEQLRTERGAYLLESALSNEHGGRYSIIGASPQTTLSARGKDITLHQLGKQSRRWTTENDVLDEVEALLAKHQHLPELCAQLPPFAGALVGYLGFDCVAEFEPSIGQSPPDDRELPDSIWMVAGEVVIFDHFAKHLYLIVHVELEEEALTTESSQASERSAAALKARYSEGKARLHALLQKLARPAPVQFFDTLAGQQQAQTAAATASSAKSNTTRQQYENMVARAKEYIHAGDIFQVVPSQRFEQDYSGSAAQLHRALRQVNPSPYMFCIEFAEGFALIGSSPELHVGLSGGTVEIRPIAGTRPRGVSPEEDQALVDELLADPKERAEHVMLVDLARNDLGRIAQAGSVQVDEFMTIERYSHVSHIVSNVRAQLREDFSAIDVLRASFPAGTVSGSPKIRAIQIIHELELNKRGPYAGAIGWLGFDGQMDSCIALRTIVLKDQVAYVQAGAGVVADSDPSAEYEETCAKARGILRAIELAQSQSRCQEN